MIGSVLGHHRIREQIGSGGMGDVYLARDERLERDVALKVLRAGALADHAARRRFRKEALALSRLNHPNIETVHEFDTHDGIDYLVMEYVAGVTLSDTLAVSSLTEKELLSLGLQLAEGLAAAHAEGVVHLDSKPGNLRVTPDGRLKILDFGLARLLAPETGAGADITKTLTDVHVVAGTLPYMAPEQLAGQPVDHRTDIWAAGVVLYEMATGRRPFEGTSSAALAAEIQVKAPTPPGSIRAGFPPALERIILKCLEKDPDLRYQSARDLRADFLRAGVASSAGPAATGTPVPSSPYRLGRGQLRRSMPAWGLVLLVVVAAGAIIGVTLQVMRRPGGPAGASAPAITSLAVLPLSDLSGQPEPGYVAEALHEAVITELSKIRALRVISRTSTLRYKGTDTPLPKIAEELDVDAILEGSVLRSGGRLRVTAQLMQVDPERHLWVDSFERDLTDVLYLTSDIARSVASQIRVTLTPAEKTSLAQARQVDARAYELYAVGRHQWNQRTLEGYRRALDSFQQALARDPGNALVHAAIGDAYMLLGEQGGIPQAEARPLAAAAIQKALELDGNLSEAHGSLGHFRFYYEWDWAGAERAFTRAIELNPGHVAARQGYGRVLGFLGRRDDAFRELQRARELDPLSVFVNAYLGQVYFFFRQYDRAGERLQWALGLNPDHPLVHHNLGELYLGQGRYADAIEHLEESVAGAAEPSTHYLAMLGSALARGNQRSRALTILDDLTARLKRGLGSGFDLASLHAALGDVPSAMAALERGYEQRDAWLAELQGWPWFDGLAREPRFQALLRRMNFPPASDVP